MSKLHHSCESTPKIPSSKNPRPAWKCHSINLTIMVLLDAKIITNSIKYLFYTINNYIIIDGNCITNFSMLRKFVGCWNHIK